MKKILIVAMADSVHTARWLRQFDSDEIEFVLFPSTPHRRVHPAMVRGGDGSALPGFGGDPRPHLSVGRET